MPSFQNATVEAKANIYFDGKVVSHTVTLADGSGKALVIILHSGDYHFGTAAAELMDIISVNCEVVLD